MEERRRHPRSPVEWPVQLWVDDELILGRTIDVSPYGICVATAPTVGLKVGNSYRVNVLASRQAELSFRARVRWAGERAAGLETDQLLPVA